MAQAQGPRKRAGQTGGAALQHRHRRRPPVRTAAAPARSSLASGIARWPSACSSRKGIRARPARNSGWRRQAARKRRLVGRPSNCGAIQAQRQLSDGFLARGRMDDELAEHGVVEAAGLPGPRRWRGRSGSSAPTPALPRRGREKMQHRAGVRHEVLVLRAQAHLDRMALKLHLLLRQRQRLACATRSCHSTRSRPVTVSVTGMLHLQPRVHLHQVERSPSCRSTRNSTVPAPT